MSLVAVLAAFAGSQAQSFEFRLKGEPVQDGATLEFEAIQGILPNEIICTPQQFTLVNLTDSTVTYSISLDVLDNSMEATALMCSGDQNQCVPFEGRWSGYIPLSPDTPTPIQYDAYPQKDGTMTTLLTVSAAGETHAVNLLFRNNGTTAISSVSGDASAVDVYDMAGRQVLSACPAAEVQSLARGVYVVRPVGRAAAASKVIVK